MSRPQVVVKKTWRSEYFLLIIFAVTSVASVIVSRLLPWTIITGELFKFGDTVVYLSLPLAVLVPTWALSLAAYRRFNVRFALDDLGIEARVGRLSFSQRINRIRFEDVRSIEVRQGVVERILDVGTIEIGTAGTSEIEVELQGIGSPREVQELIQLERDRRQMAHVEQKPSFQSSEVRFGTGGL